MAGAPPGAAPTMAEGSSPPACPAVPPSGAAVKMLAYESGAVLSHGSADGTATRQSLLRKWPLPHDTWGGRRQTAHGAPGTAAHDTGHRGICVRTDARVRALIRTEESP